MVVTHEVKESRNLTASLGRSESSLILEELCLAVTKTIKSLQKANAALLAIAGPCSDNKSTQGLSRTLFDVAHSPALSPGVRESFKTELKLIIEGQGGFPHTASFQSKVLQCEEFLRALHADPETHLTTREGFELFCEFYSHARVARLPEIERPWTLGIVAPYEVDSKRWEAMGALARMFPRVSEFRLLQLYEIEKIVCAPSAKPIINDHPEERTESDLSERDPRFAVSAIGNAGTEVLIALDGFEQVPSTKELAQRIEINETALVGRLKKLGERTDIQGTPPKLIHTLFDLLKGNPVVIEPRKVPVLERRPSDKETLFVERVKEAEQIFSHEIGRLSDIQDFLSVTREAVRDQEVASVSQYLGLCRAAREKTGSLEVKELLETLVNGIMLSRVDLNQRRSYWDTLLDLNEVVKGPIGFFFELVTSEAMQETKRALECRELINERAGEWGTEAKIYLFVQQLSAVTAKQETEHTHLVEQRAEVERMFSSERWQEIKDLLSPEEVLVFHAAVLARITVNSKFFWSLNKHIFAELISN